MNKFNKRAMSIDLYTVIFLLLNTIFFGMMFIFVSNSSSSSLTYEQYYSKEIALLIDSSTPGMVFNIPFEKGFEIAKGNSKTDNLVVIDEKTNTVRVALKSSGGYQTPYFMNYSFKVTESISTKKILIEVLDVKK